MDGKDKEKKILEYLERGILLSPDMEDDLQSLEDAPDLDALPPDAVLVGKASRSLGNEGVDWQALDAAKVKAEKHAQPAEYDRIVDLAKRHELKEKPGIKVLKNYTKRSKKYTYDDFVSHFNQRFKVLSGILRQRQELASATAIARLLARARDGQMGSRERVSIVGMVYEKSVTKNNNIILTLEDPSGQVEVFLKQDKPELAALARDLVLDEVIGVAGTLGDRIVFADQVYLPDVPLTHELKKCPDEEYLAIIGDPQVGSKMFLAKDFAKLLSWFNGKLGNAEQRSIASKVKYIAVVGDLVEGVGVYPGQEKELVLKDIKEQYRVFTEYMRQLPKEAQILLIPGNHDAGRLAEPQPPIYRDFAEELYAMENVTLLSSPSLVNIAARPGFPGFDVLLYHGYSLIYYADNIPSVRERGGQKRSELIMKFFLQRRHIAPTHGSNQYIPDPEEDPLTLDRVPDLFLTGHIHRVASATYRGVTVINASAWCDVSDDQERRGLEPQPGRLVLVNLQTRDVKVINFYSGRGKGVQVDGEETATEPAGAAP